MKIQEVLKNKKNIIISVGSSSLFLLLTGVALLNSNLLKKEEASCLNGFNNNSILINDAICQKTSKMIMEDKDLKKWENLTEIKGKINFFEQPLTNLTPLKNLKKVNEINLQGTNIKTLEGLEGLEEILTLNLRNIKSLENIKSICNITTLRNVEIETTKHLKEKCEFKSNLCQSDLINKKNQSLSYILCNKDNTKMEKRKQEIREKYEQKIKEKIEKEGQLNGK